MIRRRFFFAAPAIVAIAVSACGHEQGQQEPQRPSTSAADVNAKRTVAPELAPGDTQEARGFRAELLGGLVTNGAVTEPRVRDAIGNVPRHLFVANVDVRGAYRNAPLSIGFGQTTSEPSIVARLSEALELSGRERVLEIGTGSGYQAAVLSRLAREVYTIEIVPDLAEQARARLDRMGYMNVHVLTGDGAKGWTEHAPYDRILMTAQVDEVPRALQEQLAESGLLVAPVGPEGHGRLLRESKIAGRMAIEDLGAIELDRMTPGP
jgi:protein-L-isoaspartate(D-aspartate) O-methyltransferase